MKNPRLRHRFFALATVLGGAAILFVCTRPVADLRQAYYPALGEWFDAGNHLIVFMVWNLFFRLAWGGLSATPRLLLSAGFSALCEVVQLWVPTRGFQVLDLTVNLLPVLLWERVPRLRGWWRSKGWG